MRNVSGLRVFTIFNWYGNALRGIAHPWRYVFPENDRTTVHRDTIELITAGNLDALL